MDTILWQLKTHASFDIVFPILISLIICFGILQNDFFLLVAARIIRSVFPKKTININPLPSALVVIPSLLRNQDDFDAITTTVHSCADNQYPSKIVILASVDGRSENPNLYMELLAWVVQRQYSNNIHIYVCGTEIRSGKMMAIDAGIKFMNALISSGEQESFPEIYFSIDGDGTLSNNALSLMATKLCTPHHITGNLRRLVAGNICIRSDLFWQGWRKFFTVQGQLYLNVAREFITANIGRYNWRITPQISIPGALYATWSTLVVQAPAYMGFVQTIKWSDYIMWWLGRKPPVYSESNAAPLPEILTGASDDTCIAFIGSIAHWKNGQLSLDAPRTPLHALGRLIRNFTYERSHDYEPNAKVYTYTPSTLKALWNQRVRWNASRLECATTRFLKPFFFHWDVGLATAAQLGLIVKVVMEVVLSYMVIPYFLCKTTNSFLLTMITGYVFNTSMILMCTMMALYLEKERAKFWRTLLCLPFASFYLIVINIFSCAYGMVRDLFLFGNRNNFAPEETMIKGGSHRIAILFRIRRFFLLCIRSLFKGDVPLGWWWFDWKQKHPYVDSGYVGWSSKKKQRSILF